MTKDFLLEIGCEELPANKQDQLAKALTQNICQTLEKANLQYKSCQHFVTPRRLAVLISALDEQQPTQNIERLGPKFENAYTKDGVPSFACLGFAKSCDVAVDQLQVKETKKGKRVYCLIQEPGQATEKLLPEVIQTAIKKLPLNKSMRWGEQTSAFIRPIHWVVALFDKSIIHCDVFNISSGNLSYGHRFHHPKPITISKPQEYQQLLLTYGMVIADFNKRKEIIYKKLVQIAAPIGQVIIDPDLLNEVTAMVEWPVCLLGQFKQDFLQVPAEALITSMKTHQKCFPITDKAGKLLPYFVLVSNIESKRPEEVIKGNERVINARLADAAFFYQTDLKNSLYSHLKKLNDVVFQQQLGSLGDKTERMAKLAAYSAANLAIDSKQSQKAAKLAKCDLLSKMVGEFPSLQGIMGYYYAIHDGEPGTIATAIKEHYLPRYSGDMLPSNPLAANIALADRIDTIVGIIGIGKIPTGDKDPFALRRAALGIIRILIEKKLPLDLLELLTKAKENYQIKLSNDNVIEDAYQFIMERLRAWYLDQGVESNVFAAVYALKPTQPTDFDKRIKAVQQFQKLPEAEALAAANKRVSNILRKQAAKVDIPKKVNPEFFEFEGERLLANQLNHHEKTVHNLSKETHYQQALSELSQLKEPIDTFFDEVMVMVDNDKKRNNRLALLASLRRLMSEVADISLLS